MRNHGFFGTQFYYYWSHLKQRCNNPKSKRYKDYGGRGITYDPKWETFEGFKKDMFFKYLYALKQLQLKQPSLERLNVNGNYCFDNCIFIEFLDQNKNKQQNKWFKAISPKGKIYKSKNQREFARKNNFCYKRLNKCLNSNETYRKWKFEYMREKQFLKVFRDNEL